MSKQTEKWKAEIKELENSIPTLEGYLADHRKKLLKDTSIDFYEIERRINGGEKLLKDIKTAKTRIKLLKSKL